MINLDSIVIMSVLTSKPGMKDNLNKVLQQMVAPSRKEEGCITYDLHQSLDDPGTFTFYEVWESDKAIQAHIVSEHYKAYKEHVDELVEMRHVYRLRKV